MKKIAFLLCLMLTSLSNMIAQDVVRGKVVDRDGNPIPGVKVEIVGKPISVITEIDGSFTIPNDQTLQDIRVVYSGMQTKVLKATPDMVVTMSRTSWWNRDPVKYSWIISPQCVFSADRFRMSPPSFGIMVARVKTFGYYAKFAFSPQRTDAGLKQYQVRRNYIAAGVMCRLKSAVHAYAGLGYVDYQEHREWIVGSFKHMDYSYSGVVLDYGLLLRCGHFTVNGGAMMSLLESDLDVVANVGLGYSF